MSSYLVVDEHNELKESRKKQFPEQPATVRFLAKLISYIFHPVFVPVYVVIYMLYYHPFLFAGLTGWDKTRVWLMAFLMFSFFPLVTVLLLKGLKFINSIYLENQKDRIIPLVACGVWYFWITYTWWNSYRMEDQLSIPREAVRFALAIFISSWFALMANIKIKISLHAISMGVMLAFFVQLSLAHGTGMGAWLCLALLVTGLVCTARFISSDHYPLEVYGGLVLGVMAMQIAHWVG